VKVTAGDRVRIVEWPRTNREIGTSFDGLRGRVVGVIDDCVRVVIDGDEGSTLFAFADLEVISLHEPNMSGAE
jgi:hypothetical protein